MYTGKHEDIVRLLLKHKDININKGIKNEANLFHVSAERGLDGVVQDLITKKDYEVDIAKPNEKGYTPLYIAACFNHVKVIKIIMKYQLFADMIIDIVRYWNKYFKWNKLIPEEINLIIAMYFGKSSLNKCDPLGRTPLSVACQKGNIEAFNELIKYPNIDINKSDADGKTLFHAACQGGSVEIIGKLKTMV